VTIESSTVAPIDCRADDMEPAVALFRSLADPTRLAILRRLGVGEARVIDLVQALGMPQSTVSRHIACLRDCGLIAYRPEGRQSFYFLSQPALLALLVSAEEVLEATGRGVALCPDVRI
jgi:DNA-binding transcriptional ArsR family regulator